MIPNANTIKKSGWSDCEGRYWLFGPIGDETQIVWIVGKEIEETEYVLTFGKKTQKKVSVQNILNYKRIRSGGFKIEAAITIN